MKIEVSLNKQAIAKGYLKFLKWSAAIGILLICACVALGALALLWFKVHWTAPIVVIVMVAMLAAWAWADENQYTEEEKKVRQEAVQKRLRQECVGYSMYRGAGRSWEEL